MSSTVQLAIQLFGSVNNPRTGIVEPVKKYIWTNGNHIKVEVVSYGVTITNIHVPDKKGAVKDIVLGFDTVEGYLRSDNPYFGAAVGRVANRIGDGRFALNGVQYEVTKNLNDQHHLHGGRVGFDKYNWQSHVSGKKVVFSLMSPDGDEGYPGDLIATVTASLTDDNSFELKFNAWSTKPTPINLTNHSYFNLAGHDAGYKEMYNHTITINADRITETNSDSIPTGQFLKVDKTAFDFRKPTALGLAMEAVDAIGFDDNFCIENFTQGKVCLIGRASHPSGRAMEVYSDQAGVQFYTSNYIADPNNSIHPGGRKKYDSPNKSAPIPGKSDAEYTKHSAFCLETQKFPHAVNVPTFPSTILNPGETYKHIVVYKFIVN